MTIPTEEQCYYRNGDECAVFLTRASIAASSASYGIEVGGDGTPVVIIAPSATPTRTPTPTPTATSTPTSTETKPACPGDCDGSRVVTVDELIRMVTIALGDASLATCPASDGNGDATIAVDDIVGAIASMLEGCA